MKHIYAPLLLLVLLILTNCSSPKTNESADSKHREVKEDPLTLFVFDVGEIFVKDLALFNPGVDEGKQTTFTNTAYLIKHPKGMLIWDTGLPDAQGRTKFQLGQTTNPGLNGSYGAIFERQKC